MFTTCPNCALNLAVTAADLRVGQGYVRCGRCVSVFNALISLADEAEVGPDEAPAVEDTGAATQSRPVPAELRDASRLDLGETDEIIASPAKCSMNEASPPSSRPRRRADAGRGAGRARSSSGPDRRRRTDSRDQATGTFETIVLEGDSDPADRGVRRRSRGRRAAQGAGASSSRRTMPSSARLRRAAPRCRHFAAGARLRPPTTRTWPTTRRGPNRRRGDSTRPRPAKRPPLEWLLASAGLGLLLAGAGAAPLAAIRSRSACRGSAPSTPASARR